MGLLVSKTSVDSIREYVVPRDVFKNQFSTWDL